MTSFIISTKLSEFHGVVENFPGAMQDLINIPRVKNDGHLRILISFASGSVFRWE